MSLLLPDSGLLFWMLLSFGVVFVVLAKYGFPVITKMVEERRAYIDQSLEVARQANAQLAKLKEESDALIAAANKEQGRIMREAMHERDKIIVEARKHAEALAQKELDDVKVFDTYIRVDSGIEWSQDNNAPVIAYKKSSRSAKEYMELTREIAATLKG